MLALLVSAGKTLPTPEDRIAGSTPSEMGEFMFKGIMCKTPQISVKLWDCTPGISVNFGNIGRAF